MELLEERTQETIKTYPTKAPKKSERGRLANADSYRRAGSGLTIRRKPIDISAKGNAAKTQFKWQIQPVTDGQANVTVINRLNPTKPSKSVSCDNRATKETGTSTKNSSNQ